MNRKLVGYFEGTDARLLTGLVSDGHDTIPISNGLDNHGKHIRSVHEGSRLDLLIGYLHKIFAPHGAATTYQDIFHVCRVYEMPFLLEVPEEFHSQAEKLLGGVPDIVTLADPKQALSVAREILQR